MPIDQIAAQVDGLPGDQVARLLGEPDSRRPVLLLDERWIWWNYTFLDGEDFPPEMRGQVVHLEITLRGPSDAGADPPLSSWRVAQPFGVAYRLPGQAAAEPNPVVIVRRTP